MFPAQEVYMLGIEAGLRSDPASDLLEEEVNQDSILEIAPLRMLSDGVERVSQIEDTSGKSSS